VVHPVVFVGPHRPIADVPTSISLDHLSHVQARRSSSAGLRRPPATDVRSSGGPDRWRPTASGLRPRDSLAEPLVRPPFHTSPPSSARIPGGGADEVLQQETIRHQRGARL